MSFVRQTILLTGASGFLGSRLAARWLDEGHRVVALKRRSSSHTRLDALSGIELHDVEDGVAHAFAKTGPIDAVVHTACSYGRQGETPEQVFAANSIFALSVLQAASDHGVGTFLNTATVLDRFLNPYALSKHQFSDWGRWYAAQQKLRFVDIRLEHMYGAGDDASKFTTHVITSCDRHVPELKLTAGEQVRDFVYIDDVIEAYSLLLMRATGFDFYSSYGLGSAAAGTIRAFVELAHRLTGSRTELRFGAVPYRPGEAMHSEADIRGLTAMGWAPRYSLEQGITETIRQERQRS